MNEEPAFIIYFSTLFPFFHLLFTSSSLMITRSLGALRAPTYTIASVLALDSVIVYGQCVSLWDSVLACG